MAMTTQIDASYLQLTGGGTSLISPQYLLAWLAEQAESLDGAGLGLEAAIDSR
jgi:hypothetical protein